jgi:hypothetical protein
MTKRVNPIVKVLREYKRKSGDKFAYEKMALSAGIKYNNFMNIFTRPQISELNIWKLKEADFITERHIKDYSLWLIHEAPKKKLRPKRKLTPGRGRERREH